MGPQRQIKEVLQKNVEGGYQYAEGGMCLFEEDDTQCGHIFFNESTRMLKFFCTYCHEVYDNINLFCGHLSRHVHDEMENSLVIGKDLAEPQQYSAIGQKAESRSNADDMETYDGSEMIVEELDEAEEIAAEVEEEMRQELEGEPISVGENSCSSHFLGYDQSQGLEIRSNMPFENMDRELAGTEDEKVTGLGEVYTAAVNVIVPAKKLVKKRKITTVKVIARRNRIAELYEKIKSEEEKRSHTIPHSKHVNGLGEDGPINERLKGEEMETIAKLGGTTGATASQVTRKIIGETVITLITADNSTPPDTATNLIKTEPRSADNCRINDKTTCPACGKHFRSAFSLTIHKRSHYLESNSRIKLAHKCSDCDELFNKITDLKDHIQSVHYPDGYICKICGRKLTSLTLLETHMRKVHLARPFNCNICKKNFGSRERLEEHVNTHIGNKNYKCHICGRKYNTEYILKVHMNRHKERIQQCCVVCGKMTLRITQHMKIHAPRPKRVLSCSVCGKVFNFSSGLSHHFKIMHKNPRPPPRPKKDNKQFFPRKASQIAEHPNHGNTEEITKKEEEAKRVIVEMIQNSNTYMTYLPEDCSNALELAPPIAREETICAVNSIVNEN